MGIAGKDDESRLKARENAIETLIDMHPHGAAYRAARTMSESLTSSLQSRYNRITDSALLDSANSLSKYEILTDSQEVLRDLLTTDGQETQGEADNNDPKTNGDEERTLHEGWQARVLRHHDKIVRAKNNNSVAHSASSHMQEASTNTLPSSSYHKNAVPPPRLISALRQIFDSPSSTDLKGLIASTAADSSDTVKGDKSEPSQQQHPHVNVLPSLLHAVVNHAAFSSEPRHSSQSDSPSATVKRQLASFFDSPPQTKRGLDATEEGEDHLADGKATHHTESNKEANNNDALVSEIGSPSAANLEAIIGNVCRNILAPSAGAGGERVNSNIHGLLIASLSILTASLLEEDNLDEFPYCMPEHSATTSLEGGISTKSTSSMMVRPDSSWNATPDPNIQVGGLLALLNVTPKRGDKFLVETSLSRYFAEASSVYEERIEIQKARLQTVSTSKEKGSNEGFSTPKDETKRTSVISAGTSPPPLENLVTADNSQDNESDMKNTDEHEATDANEDANAPEDDDGLPSTTLRDSEDIINEDVSNVTRMLLSNIANLVGADLLNFDDEDGEDDVGMERDAHDIEDYEDSDGEDDDEEGDEDEVEEEESDEDSETTREYSGQEAGVNEVVQSDNHEGNENTASNDDNANNEEEETAMLQRALALSLAATVSAGASDSSNSDASENERVVSAATAPSARLKNLKSGDLKRKNSGGSTKSALSTATAECDESRSTNLPPLPTPPPLDLLPHNFFTDDCPESEIAAVLDPAALSRFGNLPASYVLVHLLQSMLGIMESDINNATKGKLQTKSFTGSAAKPAQSTTTPFSRMKKGNTMQRNDRAPRNDSKKDNGEFIPDSVTAQLLIASLHLSSFLRGYSIAALTDILLCGDNTDDDLAEDADGKDETIQIADSVESEDPIFEKEEDPALFVVATQSSLESKGLKRKAAAAADISVLRHHTKQKLVGMWIKRASFYSVSSYIIMRCLRIIMAKCLQHGLYFSDGASSGRNDVIYMSTKSRVGLSRILSSFHSASVPASVRTLQVSLDAFCATGNSQSKHLLDELLVSSLCSESLWLWGVSIPFTCPEHTARIDLLRDLSLSSAQSTAFSVIENKIKTASWNALDLRNIKLDILCQRLRMSDMLDCFVVRPKLRVDEETDTLPDQIALNVSLSTISFLGTIVEKSHPSFLSSKQDSMPNVAQLYFALCARSISSLILWNDFLLSPTEGIDQDSSLKMSLNPSKFHFDATKCADSIAIDPPGATANQRAAKVWGTVLSTTYFLPKTGIHRFAVKLDKCERGHVFVGVATARASVKTYVGGDKNGWGCIGTQALWHDRNKVRGDYGAMVRTGAVIVATLDTDLGTLSFGLWKDALPDSEGSSRPMSPSMASLASPHLDSSGGNVSGSIIEDWGTAFEGLPLDAKLYPAIGLYQRDDRATLYTISNSVTSTGKSPIPPLVSSGNVYFPSVQGANPDHVLQIRSWNQILCSNGISFTIDILARLIKLLSSETSATSSVLLSIILPPLASAICLIPSCIPSLSAKYAMELLPFVTRCAKLIDRKILSNNRHSSLNVKMKEGSWLIQAELSTSTEPDSKVCVEFEEYIIEFKQKPLQDESIDAFFEGMGTSSTSRVPHGHVYLIGAVRGTHLQFIEEWTDEDLTGQDFSFSDVLKSTSSCFINARLGLDGEKFEGVYHNVQHGTTGNISGFLLAPSINTSANETFHPLHCSAQSIDDHAEEQCEFIRTESILCLAAGHLALVLCSPTVMSDVDKVGDLTNDEAEELKRGQEILQDLLESCLIISGGRLTDGSDIRSSIDTVWERCRAVEIKGYGGGADIVEQWQDLVYFDLFSAADSSVTDGSPRRLEIECKLETHFDTFPTGHGSFACLCPLQYNGTWKNLSSVILYHCGSDLDSDCVEHAVKTSRQIMENGIRDALMLAQFSGTPKADICQKHCLLLDYISEFLYEFSCYSHDRPIQAVMDEFVYIFKTIHSYADLESLKRSLTSRTEKSIMHYVGIRAIQLLLASEDSYEGIQLCPAVESTIVSLTRLCSKSQSHSLTSIISGSSSSVQNCVEASLQSIYNKIESIFATINSIKDFVSLSSMVLALFSALESNPTKFMLDKCKNVMSHCRNLAFQENDQSSTDMTFINTIRVQSAQRILLTTTATLQSFAFMLSQQAKPANSFVPDYTNMVQLIVSCTIQEVNKTVPTVEEKYKIDRYLQELDGIGSDWDIYLVSQGVSEPSVPREKGIAAMGMTSFAKTSSMLSTKNAISPSHGYLCQLLDLLHYLVNTKPFSKTIQASACEISTSFITAMNSYLPTNSLLRLLRILRPVLLSMEASLGIVEQLLSLAGLVSYCLDVNLSVDDNLEPKSVDAAKVSGVAVATLRHLYGSKPWKHAIHDAIITSHSFQSVCGVLSFLGGMPGFLQTGAFLIIEPEIASSLLSVNSAFIGKSRGSLSGTTTSSMSNSAGRGVEGIISGLCRESALAGQLCSFDAKSGMCEVIVMSNRFVSQDFSHEPYIDNPKVTVRAVRVSSAEIASADELPLYINGDIPAVIVLRLLLEQLKSSSVVTRNARSSQVHNTQNMVDSLNDFPSLKELFTSAMSIRSLTVLLSDPKVLQHQFESCASNELQTFLALALQWASMKQGHKIINSISSLPGLEAQLWHLFSVRSILQSKRSRLENAPVSSLNELFKREFPEKKAHSPAVPSSGVSGIRTPPTSLASSFFGSLSERVSRTSTASTMAREEMAGSTRDDDDDEETQNASHLREAAIVQMAELGLPRQWAELALRRTGDIEAAVHFCLERGADMERLIAEEERVRSSSSSTSTRRRGLGVNSRMNSSHLISQLVDMGFPRHWCVSALSATSNNVDEALTWILTNGDRLSAEADDENEKEEDSEEVDNWDHDSEEGSVKGDKTIEDAHYSKETAEITSDSAIASSIGWRGSLCPIRFISGRSRINPETLEIAGLKDGGFSSVGTKGVLLTSGKWYYEAEVLTAGCLQIGWADSSFAGHCQADRGDGCGDGPSSWAFDGWRRYRWHSTATEWGCRWSEGDIVGCLVDMDEMTISFTLNGKGEEIGMGVAFSEEGFRPCSGVYCCVSFNSREKLRLVLGGEGTEPFKFKPDGYRGVGEAILSAVKERQILLEEEKAVLETNEIATNTKPSYLCDFSDGEHGHELFSWQHRYYGSDASVHLGGNRAALRGASSSKKASKSSAVSFNGSSPVLADVAIRLSKAFEKSKQKSESDEDTTQTFNAKISLLKDAYTSLLSDVDDELKAACVSLNALYAKKLVLHLLIAYSRNFSVGLFLPESPRLMSAEYEISKQLYHVIESCTSISTWLGEAGAMAVAAEALGLGISTYDSNLSDNPPAGMCTATSGQVIVCGGISQFLSSAVFPDDKQRTGGVFTPWTFAAASEAAVGSDSGGALSFIRHGLQNALVSSKPFRLTLLAGLRRAIRILSATEFSTEDGDEDTVVIASERKQGGVDADESFEYSPDARLVSFMTGVLLSKPVTKHLSESENNSIMCSLFEAWCVGLLSASSPWRMICAMTTAGILNMCPTALFHVTSRTQVIADYLWRLDSTTARRVWAERAAVPVCSKYSQALIELLSSVKRALRLCPSAQTTFLPRKIRFDAATPLPFIPSSTSSSLDGCSSWESNEGWISSNESWEVLTGTVEIMEVEWKMPQRSIVRTLMDGGEGPPFLGEGCVVMRGVDWGNRSDAGNEDGKDIYEKDKLSREVEVIADDEATDTQPECEEEKAENDSGADPAIDDDPCEPVPKQNMEDTAATEENQPIQDCTAPNLNKPDKKKKVARSKLPIGTVLSVEPWRGIPGMARRVKWHLTGKEGVYRYGGDGGRFDIAHIEVNEKETRVKKRHPLPESMEQIASRYGFGQRRSCNVILRLNHLATDTSRTSQSEILCEGILEWPDFGAGIHVECTLYSDGAISITEKKLLYGAKDSGWEARFGDPSYSPGTVTVISPISDNNFLSHEELLGSSSFLVKNLRNREQDGGRLRVISEMRLFRSRKGTLRRTNTKLDKECTVLYSSPSQLQQICFDPDFHASSLLLSKDRRTVTCSTSDGRGTAYGNVGFTTGVHYWEVKIEKAEIGSVFIGVAEKPGSPSGSSHGSSFGFESKPRLNRWLGWGFVNFRATYTAGAERVYGSHCHSGDTVGVMLDCDSGRISYFFDGVKYGEHILNDLGCAFENLSPFGFNADGCGSGGAGQGAPSSVDGVRSGRYPSNGLVRPRALWPVIGLRHPGDRVTMSSKWTTSHGVHAVTVLKNALSVDEIFCAYETEPLLPFSPSTSSLKCATFPQWFIKESFLEYKRWQSGRWVRSQTRGSGPYRLASYGLDIDLDTTPLVCAAACASIGLSFVLLPGDKVDVKRSAGRVLELQEEAVVLGAYQGRLWYRLVSQKSEGGSLMEGGGRAWFWDESEAVEGGLQLKGGGRGRSVELPKIERFKPAMGGLKIVYVGGAVVRSDLEIFDGSANIGTVPHGTSIPESDVIERRLNSCGVVRFLIDYKPIGRGWISSRIRGGKEEPIVEILPYSNEEPNRPHYTTPEDSAKQWYTRYLEAIKNESHDSRLSKRKQFAESFNIESIDEFAKLLEAGYISGMNQLESDSFITLAYGKISDVLPHSDEVDCPFIDCAILLACAVSPDNKETEFLRHSVDAVAHEIASESLSQAKSDELPSIKSLMARISMLRALNRRARFALPWLSLRPAQEGSAVFGGLSGFGASLERAGRTWDTKSSSLTQWVQVPSIPSRLRECKNLLFPSIKKSFLDSVMDATATPTPLSHDEYELPREVRTVRVNRLKARQAMSSKDGVSKRKHSVFSQLQREMRGWSGATLRRGFVAKGHGGQKRAFKVKLVGEGVNDYSGPYREVFTDAMLEVTDVDQAGHSSLGVLEPTANNEADVGDGRDLFMFANSGNANANILYMEELSCEEQEMLDSFSTLTCNTTEHSREVEDALVFLGKLAGTACRHGIPVDLPLPLGVVWDRLSEERFNAMTILKEIDLLAYRRAAEEDHNTAISSANTILSTQRRLLNSFAEGLSSVLPVELLTLFAGQQLRDILCGNPDIDVELLRRVVEYEGYNENDDVISYLWEVLREMTTSERKLFLQFVWARNRLPLKEADFDAPFRILKDTKGVKEGEDYPLPSASTCFFSLILPEYPHKEILKQKLLFAIENVTTMESDYVTNDVEVSEGWRGL